MTMRTRLGRTLLALLSALMLLAISTGAAGAQETTEEDLPAGPPGEETGSDSGGLGLDFGDSVVIDEDGTVRWNVETETGVADDDAETATPTPEGGVAGTGTAEGEGSDDEDRTGAGGASGGNNDLDSSDAAGTGSNLAMILGIAGAAVALVAGAVFLIRTRGDDEDLDVVEEVIDPTENLAGDFASGDLDPAYAGASDAGAYEEGGAAYAQYTSPDYSAGDAAATSAAATAGNKFEQIRAQVVDLADKGLADSGHERMVAKKLEAAGSKMRPGEWLVMGVAATVGALFGVTFLLGWLLGAFAAVLVAGGFWMALSVMASKRQKAFAESLPETLQLIAGSLRGGLSMLQAIQTVADEADQPTSEEFQRIVTETRLGRDLALSFRDLATRMGSKDFEWVVTAIEIHREVGGDLAIILDRVSNTIRARNRVRGQVKALSAEGRVSGLILFLLPPVMVCAIAMLNREYLNEMLNETSGQIMMIVAGVLLLVGGAWLKRLARFVY